MRQVYALATALAADGWAFVAYSRHWETDVPLPANWAVLLNRGTEEVYAAVRRASYVLVYPTDGSWYNVDRLTGAYPLAVSLCTPLMASTRFAEQYGLGPATGAVHGDGVDALAAAVRAVTPAGYAGMVAGLQAYRDRLVARNNELLDVLLLSVPGDGTRAVGVPMPERIGRLA